MNNSMKLVLLHMTKKYQGNWDKIYDALDRKERFTVDELQKTEHWAKTHNIKFYSILCIEYPNEFKKIYKPPFVIFENSNGKYTEHPSQKVFYSISKITNIKMAEASGLKESSTKYEEDILLHMTQKADKEIGEGKVINLSNLFAQAETIAIKRINESEKVVVVIKDMTIEGHPTYLEARVHWKQAKKTIFKTFTGNAGYNDEELKALFGSSNYADYKLDAKFNLIAPNHSINLGFNQDKKISIEGSKEQLNQLIDIKNKTQERGF